MEFNKGDSVRLVYENENGHIIHEGAIGVAQAASYALKKIYEKLGGEF